MAPAGIRAIDRWANSAKPHALIELPIDHNSNYEVMLHATAHHRPIANGVSGFDPPEYSRIVALAEAWSDGFVPELARIGGQKRTSMVVDPVTKQTHGVAYDLGQAFADRLKVPAE